MFPTKGKNTQKNFYDEREFPTTHEKNNGVHPQPDATKYVQQ